MSYRTRAFAAYGTACEWIGCGWNQGTCDVHHINYQEHERYETAIRDAFRVGKTYIAEQLIQEAKTLGFLKYDRKLHQLSKDDRLQNLAVLCPNHHRFVHTKDLGLEILHYIPERKHE